MSLPVIQSLFGIVDNELSCLEKLCIRSFIDHGHEFHLYTYRDIGGIPEGTVIKDGNEILPRDNIYLGGGSHAPFSDWFRYQLLYQRGGFWVDMDTVCIKPFDFADEIIFGYEAHGVACNAIMAFPKGSEILAKMVDACSEPNMDMPWDDQSKLADKKKHRKSNTDRRKLDYLELGPRLINSVVRHYNLTDKGLPFTAFYPIPYRYWARFFDRTFANGKLHPDTYAVHFWSAMLIRADLDKNAQFDSESLFEQLKAKHNIKQISAADINRYSMSITDSSAEIIAVAKRMKNRRMVLRLIAGAGAVAIVIVSLIFLMW